METIYAKDLTPCKSQNNKVRIFGTLVSEPEQYFDSELFYVKLNCPVQRSSTVESPPNNIIVCMNKKTKEKYFDSHLYNPNDQLIIHGTTRNFLRTIVKDDGSKKLRDEFFVMMERVHRYPENGQIYLKNNIGIAIGKISRYCTRLVSNGNLFVDVVLKVDNNPYYSMLNLSTIGRPLLKIMHTQIGDTVGFKYNLKTFETNSGYNFMKLNTFCVNCNQETLYSDGFQDFDFTPENFAAATNQSDFDEIEKNFEIRKKFAQEHNIPENIFYQMYAMPKPYENDEPYNNSESCENVDDIGPHA